MALETRGGRTYYYTAKRLGGRVVKTYEGAGYIAELESRLDTIKREKEHAERIQAKGQAERVASNCRSVWESTDHAGGLASLLIEGAGYHRHDRGRWRKKRMVKFVDGTRGQDAESKAAEQVPTTTQERRALVLRAMDSKDKALRALAMATLKQYPDELTGNYLNEVVTAVSRLTENEIGQQMFLNEAGRMRKNFYEGRETVTIPYAERLLIERVIACRFALSHTEHMAAKGSSIAVGEYWQRALDRAHRRYLSAIKTLAEVKRLSLPMVAVALPGSTQVNIGEKQVNVSMGRESANRESANRESVNRESANRESVNREMGNATG